MISNAKNKKINQNSHLPNMSSTIVDWFLPITVGVISRSVTDYEQVKTAKWIKTKGVVQQYKTQDLEITKEGYRSWDLLQIHCLPDLQLENDDLIIYKDVLYKVMNNNNYSDYGYMEYICVETYLGEANG